MRQTLFALLAVGVVGGSIRAEEPRRFRIEKDIPYSTVSAQKNLQMDVTVPVGKGPFPAVMLLHGGAWRFGTRHDVETWDTFLANEGFVTAAVSYRLLPDGKFPEPLIDCKTAVRFLRKNAATYKIDPDKIGVLGFSAGGHLAALLGTVHDRPEFEGKQHGGPSSEIQAVVDFFGPSDMTAYRDDESAQRSTLIPFLGGSYKEKPELYTSASPISYVSKKSAPFLILHGGKDWLVGIDQSRRMYKKLKEAGVDAAMIEFEEAGHGFSGADGRLATEATLKFLNRILKK